MRHPHHNFFLSWLLNFRAPIFHISWQTDTPHVITFRFEQRPWMAVLFLLIISQKSSITMATYRILPPRTLFQIPFSQIFPPCFQTAFLCVIWSPLLPRHLGADSRNLGLVTSAYLPSPPSQWRGRNTVRSEEQVRCHLTLAPDKFDVPLGWDFAE